MPSPNTKINSGSSRRLATAPMITEDHAGCCIALGINERIHAGGSHGWKCTEQIDHQVGVCIGQPGIRSTKKYQNRSGKEQSYDHQDNRA